MRVCQIVPSLEERHGGPSISVRALANAMALGGTPTTLLTTQETGHAMRANEDAADMRVFPRETPRWLCRSRAMQDHLRRERYDCIHDHALWLLPLHYAHRAARQHGVPLVISPRGMMSPWAWQHHRARKKLAEIFVHPGAFAATAGWHATSTAEADDIRARGFTQPICVAPNGVELPTADDLAAAKQTWLTICPAATQRPVALFYSRFHRKKRLRELIDLWSAQPNRDWFLLLVGVPEEFSVDEVQSWIAAAGLDRHAAVFDGRDKPAPYAIASLFLLPTHSENFGLAVAEALAAGVPALVTDTAPWNDLHTHHSGWCVSWQEYAVALSKALATSTVERTAMGANGRAWMRRDYTWDGAARKLVDFYSTLR